MITMNYIRGMSNNQYTTRFVLALVAVALAMFSNFPTNQQSKHLDYPSMMFQTSRLPEPESKPASWVFAGEGGRREFDAITVVLPSGFTNQGGANVFANRLIDPSSLRKPPKILPGTEFTVGIWPPNDQMQFQRPIEIRIMINAAQVSSGDQQNLTLMMYNPETDTWEAQPSKFVESTFEVVTSIQTFKPVAKDFPNWGGRTFFCVANLGLNTSTAASTVAVVNLNANLRTGPGVTYAIIGQAAKGQPVQLTAKSANGRWYKLDSGAWIAAFLVDNAPELPVASVTPRPPVPSVTSTPTPNSTPTA